MTAGRDWADKVYQQKLADPRSLPNLGTGFSDELRAARALQAIAERKLYTVSGRGGHVRVANSLRPADRNFWQDVAKRAGELAVAAPPKGTSKKRALRGFSMDDFDWGETADEAPAADVEYTRYTSAGRGESFRVQGQAFQIFSSQGVVKFVTKVGTAGRKFYKVMPARSTPLQVDVRQVLHQVPERLGPIIAQGAITWL